MMIGRGPNDRPHRPEPRPVSIRERPAEEPSDIAAVFNAADTVLEHDQLQIDGNRIYFCVGPRRKMADSACKTQICSCD